MKNKNKSSDRGKAKEIVEDEETIRLKENIYVVFVECESPGNVGFLARTMGNFGLHKLVLINPCTLKDEAYYQAMHARETVENAMIYDTVEEFVKDQNIDFIGGIRGLKELEERADAENSAAFAMHPTSLAELFAVADAGMLMPPKSTWFEPKLRSGLFIHEIEK